MLYVPHLPVRIEIKKDGWFTYSIQCILAVFVAVFVQSELLQAFA
jgi:hypothetical protein